MNDLSAVDISASSHFFGNLIGNVTGDITGNVTGDVEGNLTGDVTGDIYANNGTSIILENGTNGTDAIFTGAVTGQGSSSFPIVDINGGNIDGTTIATSDVTVGTGKTLNVSGGTLTTSAAQNLAIMQGAGANVDVGAFDLRAQTVTADG